MKLQRISPEKIIELVTEYHLSGKQDRHILGKSVADAQLSSDKAKLKRLFKEIEKQADDFGDIQIFDDEWQSLKKEWLE